MVLILRQERGIAPPLVFGSALGFFARALFSFVLR